MPEMYLNLLNLIFHQDKELLKAELNKFDLNQAIENLKNKKWSDVIFFDFLKELNSHKCLTYTKISKSKILETTLDMFLQSKITPLICLNLLKFLADNSIISHHTFITTIKPIDGAICARIFNRGHWNQQQYFEVLEFMVANGVMGQAYV